MMVTGCEFLPPIVLVPEGGLRSLNFAGWRWPFDGGMPPDVLMPAEGECRILPIVCGGLPRRATS